MIKSTKCRSKKGPEFSAKNTNGSFKCESIKARLITDNIKAQDDRLVNFQIQIPREATKRNFFRC